MGISLLDALIIQGNEVNVEVYSNKEKTQYGFIISRMERDNYRIIVSTLPNCPYNTKKEAEKAGKSIVEEVRKLDLVSEKSKLMGIIGKEEAQAVSEILKSVNNPFR